MADTKSTDDFNEVTRSWSQLAEVWAAIDWSADRNDKEELEGAKETVFGEIAVLIRYRTDIDETMRLQYDSIDYDIKSINRHESRGRDRYLIIKARKVI